MAVADAIVATQIRRRLGRRDHVVSRHREVRGRQFDLGNHTTLGAVEFNGGIDGRSDLRSDALTEETLGNTDAKLLGLARCGQRTLIGAEAGHVASVGRSQRREQQFAVFDAAGHRANLVERRCEGHETEAGH